MQLVTQGVNMTVHNTSLGQLLQLYQWGRFSTKTSCKLSACLTDSTCNSECDHADKDQEIILQQ